MPRQFASSLRRYKRLSEKQRGGTALRFGPALDVGPTWRPIESWEQSLIICMALLVWTCNL